MGQTEPSPLSHYMLAAPADALESVFPAFELFVENTVASDQFLKANEKLGVELANIVSRSRMQYIDDLLAQETTGNDSYNEDRFSDYLFDQNDYTLSDGSHVKIPTEYDHVYEGDNNTIYFSSSAFGGTGTELTPNR